MYPLLGGRRVPNNGVFTRMRQAIFWFFLALRSLPSRLYEHVSGKYLFNPSHLCFRSWKFIVLLAVAVVSWTSTYLICFTYVHEVTPTRRWIIVEYTVFVIFFIDNLVSFNTPYVDENTNIEVLDRYEIFKNCVNPMMVIDLIVSVPVSLVIQLPLPTLATKIISIAWIVVRSLQARKLLFTREIPRLCFIIVFSIHFIGCFFYLIARDNPFVTKTWVDLEKDEASNETWLFPYIMSYYWSATGFTTVGFGDIHPVNSIEMGYSIGVMIFNTGLLSYVSDAFLELLKAYIRVGTLGDHIKALREFCLANSLSEDLKREMISYLTHRGMRYDEVKQGFSILCLFSRQLQSIIKAELFTEHFQMLTLLQGVSPAFLFELVAELEVEIFEPNEVVIVANEFLSKMYFGWRGGVVREIDQASSSGTVELEVCGELGVLGFVPQPYTYRTTSSSLLLSISRTTLLRLLELHRGELKILLQNVLAEAFEKDQSIFNDAVVEQSFQEQSILNDAVVEQSFQDQSIFLPITSLSSYYDSAITGDNQNLLTMAYRYSGGQVDISISALEETPLLKAVKCNNIKAAKFLMQYHAKSDIPDSTGSTARAVANSDGSSEEMRQLFDGYGD